MALTETAIRNAKPARKARKIADAGGLYLLLSPQGGRWWRLDYRHGGKRNTLSMGVYPAVGLKDARARRDDARKLLARGVDPGSIRKESRKAREAAQGNGFEAIAREWFAKHSPTWAASHAAKVQRRLEQDVFPWIGGRAVSEVTAQELLAVLRRIESRGAGDAARRVRQDCGKVFRYAVATGRADRDPSGDLRGALAPVKSSHYPSITDTKAVGALLRALDGYQGSFAARCALRLAPLLFVRPGELRQAEWAEVDLDKAEWRIPAAKMKMRRPHIVPLARQAVEVLRDLQPLTGTGRYLFPSARTAARPMSNNTMNAALRRLGYAKEEMTPHGFRSMASTILNEQGWNRDIIERQLAHSEQDGSRAAYNFAEHLTERRRMMQSWADFLDGLAQGADVVPFRRPGQARAEQAAP